MDKKNTSLSPEQKDDLINKIIIDIAQAHKNNVVFDFVYNNNPVKDFLLKHQEKHHLNFDDMMKFCKDLFIKSQEITTLLYQTCFDLQQQYIVIAQQNIEIQIDKLNKKQIYSANDIIDMQNIFGIKTKNTLIKKLQNGELKGRMVNNKWQIQRKDLVDFVGHSDF